MKQVEKRFYEEKNLGDYQLNDFLSWFMLFTGPKLDEVDLGFN